MKHLLGRAAASTLGYIVGNAPGAVAADTFYKLARTSTNMGTSKKRKRPGPKPKIPRKAKAKSVGSKKKTRARRGGTNDGADNYQTSHYQSGKKVSSKPGGRKRIKVSKRLKKAIKQTLENVTPSGYYQERYYNKYSPGDLDQFVTDLGGGSFATETGISKGLTGNGTNLFFDPIKVLHAASVLFNDQTPQGDKLIGATGLFDPKFALVDVVKQWVRFEMKNNSSRTLIIKLFTWAFKKDAQTIGDATQTFTKEWELAFTSEGNGGPGGDGKINVQNINQNVIGAHPGMSPAIRRKFKIEEKEIRLEAGKTFVHYLQGASMLYEYAKFQESGSFDNYQHMCRGVAMAMYTDLTGVESGAAGQSHRYTELPADRTGPYGLCVEATLNYVIRLPEQAGFTFGSSTASGTRQQLENRIAHPYCIKNWDRIARGVKKIQDKSDEQPADLGTTGL